MIQYQYYHTGSGYISAFGIDPKSQEARTLEKVFDAVRKNSGNNFFSYACVKSGQIFMAQGATGKDLFVHGLYGSFEELERWPAAYIGALNSQPDPNVVGSELGEYTLPNVVGSLDNANENVEAIMPALAEAILYGEFDRPIVVLAESRKQAAACMRFLSRLFPISFVRKLGFCIGCSSLPEQEICVLDGTGEDLSFSFKVLFPENTKVDFEAISFSCYCFDIASRRHNWNSELGSFGKLLSALNLRDDSVVRSLTDALASAFDRDGRVNLTLLDQLVSLCVFRLKPTLEAARKIFEVAFSGGISQANATAEAIKLLLAAEGEDAITDAQISQIARYYYQDAKVADFVGDALFDFMVPRIARLSAAEKQLVADLVCKERSEERFKILLSESLQGEFAPISAAFEVFAMMVKKWGDGAEINSETASLVQQAIAFFDFGNFSGCVPVDDWLEAGEPLFVLTAAQENTEVRLLLSSVLMASAFLRDSDWKDLRSVGLKKMVTEKRLSKFEQLEFVLSVRKKISELMDYMPIAMRAVDDDFILGCPRGKQWVGEILQSFSPKELLDAEKKTRVEGDFASMLALLQEKLLDLTFVKLHIRGEQLESAYIKFFETLSQEKKSMHGDIYRYFTRLENAKKANEVIKNFRFDFADGCYQTLSSKDKKTVCGNAKLDTLDRSDAGNSVAKTAEVFGKIVTVQMSKKKNTQELRHIITILNGILWTIIAAVLAEMATYVVGARDYYSFIFQWKIFPIISAIGAIRFYCFNLETNSIVKRNLITAAETIGLIAVLLAVFRLIVL